MRSALLIFVISLAVPFAPQGGAGRYSKDGLSFDYPAAWKTLLDTLTVEGPAQPSPEAEKIDRIVMGGVLNGKAVRKPAPEYPPIARSARASGTVVVQLVVDEKGEVAEAHAVSGHQLLQGSSVEAARRAKFTPTTLCGRPVKVSGIVTYNYVLR